MGLYAIGDLHLPGGQEKPMDIFGDHWEDHFARISQDWRRRVKETDTVLIPGDISWAMQLKDARPDLEAIGALPGRLREFRMYSMAVRLLSQIYSSSNPAAVLPSVSSLSLR